MVREKWIIDDTYKKECIDKLSSKLGAIRTTLDVSQEEFAHIIGTTRQTYNAIEARRKEMSWSTYLAIVAILFSNGQTRRILKEFNLYPKEFVQRIARNNIDFL